MTEEMKKRGETQGRVFFTSLKHDKNEESWTNTERVEKLLKETKGSLEIYTITHKEEEEKEKHQHFVIIYKTPRKLKNVAKMFNVEFNFINKAISKKAQLRYLTHMDDEDKEKYSFDKVKTNSTKPYWQQVVQNEMSDNEIYEYIKVNGINKVGTLIGIVEINKLNNIIRLIREIRKG